MKTAIFVIAAAFTASVAAHAQTTSSPSTVPTNSPGRGSTDMKDSRLAPGGVIYTQPTGGSSADTGPVSLPTPTRPLVSGPNPPPVPPPETGADTTARRRDADQ